MSLEQPKTDLETKKVELKALLRGLPERSGQHEYLNESDEKFDKIKQLVIDILEPKLQGPSSRESIGKLIELTANTAFNESDEGFNGEFSRIDKDFSKMTGYWISLAHKVVSE